jgi:hypothetical protein
MVFSVSKRKKTVRGSGGAVRLEPLLSKQKKRMGRYSKIDSQGVFYYDSPMMEEGPIFLDSFRF